MAVQTKFVKKVKKHATFLIFGVSLLMKVQSIKVTTMKKISRREAETLIQAENILDSNVVQDQDEMRILLTLSNNQTFLLKYDLHAHDKSYYLT